MAPIAKRLIGGPAAATQFDDSRLLEYRNGNLVAIRIDDPGCTMYDDGACRFYRDGNGALRVGHAVWIPRADSSAA